MEYLTNQLLQPNLNNSQMKISECNLDEALNDKLFHLGKYRWLK